MSNILTGRFIIVWAATCCCLKAELSPLYKIALSDNKSGERERMVGLFSVRVYYLSLPDIQPATSYNQNICGEAPQPTVSAQYNLVPTVGPPV